MERCHLHGLLRSLRRCQKSYTGEILNNHINTEPYKLNTTDVSHFQMTYYHSKTYQSWSRFLEHVAFSKRIRW